MNGLNISIDFKEAMTLISLLIGGCWALGRAVLAQTQKQLREQFEQINAHLRGQDETARRLEREILEMKAELPREYVRREDYVQAVATIMTKLDAMALRFENLMLLKDKPNG